MYMMLNFILAGVKHNDNIINNFFRNRLLISINYNFLILIKINLKISLIKRQEKETGNITYWKNS